MNISTLNRTRTYRYILPLSCVALVFIVLLLQQTDDKRSEDAQCQISGTSKCIILRQNKEFSLELYKRPQIEEEIRLRLEYPNSYELSKAWVQGVNMYMGQSAVVIEKTKFSAKQNTTKGLFFLGACSEKNMIWQIVTIYTDPLSGHEVKLFYNFATHQ